MASSLPRLLLALTGLSALACVGGGALLSRHESVQRLPRDSTALERFALDLAEELSRLEALYGSHLSELASKTEDAFAAVGAAERVWGVRQVSVLGRADDPTRDSHARMGQGQQQDWAEPAFARERGLPGRPQRLLDPGLLEKPLTASGWIDTPGEPLLYWHRAATRRVVVLTVERATVAGRIDEALAEWLASAFAPLRKEGENTLLSGPGGVLVTAGVSGGDAPPDLLLPRPGRFGTWQVAAWDRRQTVIHYDWAWLGGGLGLALLITAGGVLVAWRVGSALRLAEQQVSFVNRVSHELRTPLTNILLHADLAAEAGTPPVRRRLAIVTEEARRLDRLIGNVLSFARRDQKPQPLKAEPLLVEPLVRAALEPCLPALERAGITVTVDIAPSLTAQGDADAVTQILGNLISNVEKYAASGGRLDIRAAHLANYLSLTISDAGPGIPAEEAERVFAPFHRLDDRTSARATGIGLGLAIARDLAERQGGSLRLEPPDAGAVFVLCLPAAESGIIPFPDAVAS